MSGLVARIERLIGKREYAGALGLIRAEENAKRKAGLSRRLRQLKGLALARLGSWREAQQILEALYNDGKLDAETIGIYARTWMDRYDKSCRRSDLRRSREVQGGRERTLPRDHDSR